MAAGVDGGLGERLFRMLGAQIACGVRLSQVCVSQLFTCNCPSGVWANVRLGLRGRFLPAALPHCLCLPRCFAGQNSSPRRNSAQGRPIHSPLPAQRLSVWCQRPVIPEYYTKTMIYPKNPFGLAGSPFWTSACPRLGVYLILGAMGPKVVVHSPSTLRTMRGFSLSLFRSPDSEW